MVLTEKLYFEALEEHRGWYIEKYLPPSPGVPFATLSLTCLGERPKNDVALEMEAEARRWLTRYAYPLMVSAFDQRGDLIDLEGVRPESHLMCLWDSSRRSVTNRWRLLKDEEFPVQNPTGQYLQSIYADVPFKTSADLRANAQASLRERRLGWWVVFFWVAVLPAIVAILEFFSPIWVAVIVLLYSLWKAGQKALRLLGKIEPSEKEKTKAETERRMRHHHYHCEENPEGFLRLKLENFERWGREEIEAKSEALKKKAKAEK